MDALSSLLDGPRARGAFLLRVVLDRPWSLLVRDRSPLTLIALARGSAWLVPDGADAVPLCAGDVALVRGGNPYTVADDPATPPTVIIEHGQRGTTPRGEPLCEEFSLGPRTWGTAVTASTTMLVGAYPVGGEIGSRLLSALPEVAVVGRGELESPLVGLLDAEIEREQPGQDVVLDRLLDLLLVTAVRAWSAHSQAVGSWYRAHTDPVVGEALRLLHDDPAYPWTVKELAERTGVSRAALARRFSGLVGESPMAYLTEWRLALAADLLREPDSTVESVARKVGYGSAFALSAAFKRVRGVSPRRYREASGG
ncbi:DNA-binding domain-containing protein, AraC-type [Saccharomonospora marina XMU15]|uniref:DNA-binding domain-containing protein, AraC-type n=1 Tax=Saccharomonospora marina XMU15 TaxID=882083 RepID=H5X9J7_9PSEU|nr:AraC family transcriptional regulator [Saccharomonospora marina]EHR50362.1 DNA-binding domain-containing protein, AraC-type [Saccharomonospora marina XMU15]